MPDQPSPENPFSREVLDLFDAYVHGALSRRGFLEKGAALLGTAAAANTALAALSPNFSAAQKVPADDVRLHVTRESIASPDGYGTIKAYVVRRVRPAVRGRHPAVLVAHENRGLNPHIEDIARRLALEGFVAVAPDALTPLGGYPGDEDRARALFGQLDAAKTQADFVAAARWAEALPGGTGKLGAVGFCWGGGTVNRLATTMPSLRAAVPFYGSPPPLDAVPAIRAELLLHFAGNDARIDAMWPGYESALKAAGRRYQAFTYPGVEHGFNNDTTPRFNAEAAKLAWNRTVALFKRTLV